MSGTRTRLFSRPIPKHWRWWLKLYEVKTTKEVVFRERWPCEARFLRKENTVRIREGERKYTSPNGEPTGERALKKAQKATWGTKDQRKLNHIWWVTTGEIGAEKRVDRGGSRQKKQGTAKSRWIELKTKKKGEDEIYEGIPRDWQ